jgi:hypothetical protein
MLKGLYHSARQLLAATAFVLLASSCALEEPEPEEEILGETSQAVCRWNHYHFDNMTCDIYQCDGICMYWCRDGYETWQGDC